MSEAKKLTQEEILKSLDAIIDETMGKDEEVAQPAASTETVVKSEEGKNENKQANGGEDKIKSGSPMSEEQKAEEAKKAKEKKDKEEKEAKEKAMKEEAEKSAQVEADLKKSADKDADDKKSKKESEDKDADDKKKAEKKMKKSLEELAAAGLDSDELELIKAWREENDEEESEEEAPADIAKAVAQAVGAQLEDIKKSFEQKMSEKDDMIKSLSAEVKKLSSQPAHGKQSVDSLETIEKSGASNTEISKAQVLDTMLELQKAGKGINSQHIAEFEATKNLSNPQVKALVMEATKKRFSN